VHYVHATGLMVGARYRAGMGVGKREVVGEISRRGEELVMREIASRREQLVDLLVRLIAFDTRAQPPEGGGGEEAALQEYLRGRLLAAGFEVEVWEPDPSSFGAHLLEFPQGYDFVGRPQLVARARGPGGGRNLLLNGHVDVVSVEPRERWRTDPLVGSVRRGAVYGRGACDMKGGVAAMVLAAEVLRALEVPLLGDLILNTVTDEESTGGGSLATAFRGLGADGGLIPEPTSLSVWLGARGSLLAKITVTGRPGHAGLTQRDHFDGGAVNAIEKMQVVLDALRRLRAEWQVDPAIRNPHLAAGGIVPTAITGGEWIVSYPASCTLRCHVQYLPEQADPDGRGGRVQREVEQRISAAAVTDAWLREHPPSVEWERGAVPTGLVAPDTPIAATTLQTTRDLGLGGVIASRTTFFDGPTFTAAGTPTVAFGPGDINRAHTVDEHVSIDELVRAAQALAVTAMRFCGLAPPNHNQRRDLP